MLTAITRWQAELAQAVKERFGVELAPEAVPFTFPPKPELGDASTPVAFSLAKILKRPPASIAQELAGIPLSKVRETKAAGGYLNLYVDRSWALEQLLKGRFVPAGAEGKVIVEHTNINPNKAAHVGHLRNAVMGDTLVRALKYLGGRAEVQNYIDDTGVQVADVVVGFQRILGWDLERVRAAAGGAEGSPFDVFCWDLYAKVAPWYEQSEGNKSARLDTLHLMEAGGNETAAMASLIASEMVRCHLTTMDRLGIRYDVLPHESDILKTGFWAACFEKLKASGAVHKVPEDSEDKNRGCWVMALQESDEFKGMSDADKVIVRSNGTVTYIGKDMAYQLWKFGLLGRDFYYRRFENPLYEIWRTDAGQEGAAGKDVGATSRSRLVGPAEDENRRQEAAPTGAPSFGNGQRVINVIDVRQSYLQKIVKEGVRLMGYEREAGSSVHFAYEMVALSQKTAAEFEKAGQISLSDEERQKPFVEMSGRKGLGVQADKLLDLLEEKAAEEIAKREPEIPGPEKAERSKTLAVGALRYYMIKYGKNAIIPFDFEQALAFEGDTGPYLQYACVRAENILRKGLEQGIEAPGTDDLRALQECAPDFDDEGWALLSLFLRVPVQVNSAVENLDLNLIARQYFAAAQSFHTYYHHYPVLQETDPKKRRARLLTVALFARLLRNGLKDLLGIPVPQRM